MELLSLILLIIIAVMVLAHILCVMYRLYGRGGHKLLAKGGILIDPNTEIDERRYPSYIRNKQGLWLHHYEWMVPDKKSAVGVVFLVHGLGECVGRYAHVARYFLENNFHVFGIDHQGHGRSLGDRIYVNEFQDYVDDYVLYVNTVLSKNTFLADMPRFLFGHSLGGLISLNIGQQNPDLFTGIVCSAPPLRAAVSSFMKGVAKGIACIFPFMTLGSLDLDMMSHDKLSVALVREDPTYYQGGLNAAILSTLFKNQDELMSTCSTNWTAPLLLLHGDKDSTCLVAGSQEFYDSIPSQDKTLKFYDGEYHEIFNEFTWQDHLEEVLLWVRERIK